MEKNLDIFYFSGTHWDREWYQDFQGFRYRLVQMIDRTVELLEKDKDFKTFHFDGQTVVLEDYCEISPQKRDALKKLIDEKRILIGPWYVMPDEFLVSGESLIRNLMIGHKVCKEWGAEPWKFGYICDIFGHTAQTPQIFKGFGIDYSLLGRGTYETDPTFFKWRSPDGSESINFKLNPDGGYGNFNQWGYMLVDDTSPESPEMIEKIKERVDVEIARNELPIVVIMDGLDHSDASVHTTGYIKKIAEMYPNARVHHCDLREMGKMAAEYDLPVIEGELNRTSQNKYEYLHLITDTLSSYYTVKKKNDECQNLLEKQIEPLCVMSGLEGNRVDRSFVEFAYRYLIKNHPHDSICGCSVDKVHKDMEYRFSQVEGIGAAIREEYLFNDAKKFENDISSGEGILTLYNTLPFAVEKTVTVDIDFKCGYPNKFEEPFGYKDEVNCFKILDHKGNEIPYGRVKVMRNATKRVYANINYNVDVHTVSFKVFLPACGKAEYKIVPTAPAVRYFEHIKSGADYAENSKVRLDILSDGLLKITDKKTGKTYTGLGGLVDDGEIGDGWYHVNPVNDTVYYSNSGSCEIAKVESGPSRCVFKVTKTMHLPEEMIQSPFGKTRSERLTEIRFSFYVGLSEESRYVDVKLCFDNTAKDHRLKLTLPTGVKGDKYFSGQTFYCCERNVGADKSTQDWREPDRIEKSTNGIFGKRDDSGCGIAFVSAKGLHEVSSYDDEKGTLAVTLLRSFRTTVRTNGETRCQLNLPLEYEFAFAPVDSATPYSELLKLQDIMSTDVLASFTETKQDAASPVSHIEVGGNNICTSIIKWAEDDDKSLIVRVYNASDDLSCAFIKTASKIVKAEQVNLNEEYICELPFDENGIKVEIPKWKIATFKVKLA